MKLAIDSCCYHGYFGEWYEGLQTAPGTRLSVGDFLSKAHKSRVEGVWRLSLALCPTAPLALRRAVALT